MAPMNAALKFAFTGLTVILALLNQPCTAQVPNTWAQKANVGGVGRQEASGFSIGAKGYIGIGIDINGIYHKDFWEYDPATNAWTQKADFGGTARHAAVGFSIGSKGYIGVGQDITTYRNDFWEYDPALNTWTQKADFGGIGRYQAVGFSIGAKGYIGTGWTAVSQLLQDFWEYDPALNTWSQKANVGGGLRANAVGFKIGSKGYIGTGNTQSSAQTTDFWEYDPTANTWTQKADFAGTARRWASGFSIGNKGYLGTGLTPPNNLASDFWEYDPVANLWTQRATFGGGQWEEPVGFCIGTKGYFGTGVSILTGTTNGFWEYTPLCATPTAPVNTTPSANLTVCSGNSTTLSAGGSGTLGWYNAPTGGTWLGGGSGYTTPALTVNTTYYVQDSLCTASATRTAIAVAVTAAPAIFNVTGGGSFCAGGTGVAVGLSGSAAGITYTLLRGSTVVSALPGTGAALGFGLQTLAGIYTVVAGYGSATCTALMNGSATVTVNSLPVPTITGPATPCVGTTGNVYVTQPGMTNYVWTVTPGGSVTSGGTSASNSITVTWTSGGGNIVTVNYTNSAGCSAAAATTFSVTVSSGTVPTIGSTNTPCAGSTGNIYYTENGMTGYVWAVSTGGSIASGQGTSVANVTWNGMGLQWVSVTYTTTFSCPVSAPGIYNLFVNPVPNAAGAITGTYQVCEGAMGVAYSCPDILNATSYTWTIPSGATIATGAGTRNITVNFGTAVSGNITVMGINSCGPGPTSPDFHVSINAIPDAPTITVSGNLLTSSAPTGNQWYYEGTAIAGATGQTYSVTNNTGYYWCRVTIFGCSSPVSNKVWIVVTGEQEMQRRNFTIYPVPNEGRFTISISSMTEERYDVMVYNQLGAKVFELRDLFVTGIVEKEIDISPAAKGIYTVVLLNCDHKMARKVLINM